MSEQEAVVYWPVLGASLALLGVSALVLSWGYLTVASVWLRDAWKRHRQDHQLWLDGQVRADTRRAAASFPGGSYEGVER